MALSGAAITPAAPKSLRSEIRHLRRWRRPPGKGQRTSEILVGGCSCSYGSGSPAQAASAGTNSEGLTLSVKLGCMAASAAIGFALLVLLLMPYRLETVESIVSANGTGCAISTTSNGGWREEVGASRVAYPLDIFVFVDSCAGVPEGRPLSAELVSARSGKVIALGLSCSGAEHAEGYPCRLELPPLSTLAGHDRFRVRVVKAKGQEPGAAELQLFLKREWRSAVIDGIMSV